MATSCLGCVLGGGGEVGVGGVHGKARHLVPVHGTDHGRVLVVLVATARPQPHRAVGRACNREGRKTGQGSGRGRWLRLGKWG